MALSIPPHLAFSPGPSTRAILASSKLTSATPENGEKDVYTSLSRVILKWSTRLLIYCSIPSSWRNAVEIEKNRGFCNSNTISTPRKLFCNKHEKVRYFYSTTVTKSSWSFPSIEDGWFLEKEDACLFI